MPDRGDWRCVRLETFEQFTQLAEAWSELLARAQLGNVFLTHAWMRAWWQQYGTGHQLWTLVIRRQDQLMGIVPLVRAHDDGGVRRLFFMSDFQVTPNHLDVIACPESRLQVIRVLSEYLTHHRREWDILELNRLPAESPTRETLTQFFAAHHTPWQSEPTRRCPFAVLPDTYAAYLEARGRETRKQLRQAFRTLARDLPQAQLGQIGAHAELDAAFDAMVALHHAHWGARGETGGYASEKFTAVHRAVAHDALERGTLRFYYVRVDDAYAAVYYCYRADARIQAYTTVFDERWTKQRLGMILLAYALEQSIGEGAREFDFLQGEESYKAHWATQVREDWSVRIASPHPAGHWAWGKRYLPHQMRQSLKHLLPQREGD